MLVRDLSGKWYEVGDSNLKGKEIEPGKAAELQATARAEARKKAAEMLSGLDEETIVALRESLVRAGLPQAGAGPEITPGGSGPVVGPGEIASNDCWNNDCHTNDCHTNDCHTNDCHGNDCHSEYGGVVWRPGEWWSRAVSGRAMRRMRYPQPRVTRR